MTSVNKNITLKPPVSVVITGGAGNIGGYAALLVATGAMLGKDQPVDLRLLDIPQAAKAMKGVIMELNDGAHRLLNSVIGTSDYKEAFEDVDIALLIGAKPRSPGQERADLMRDNAHIFRGQGKALDQYASRNVKIVVVGNPANTNCQILRDNAPGLAPSCFSALTRLDQNRACSKLASRLGVHVTQIHNMVIWGNHSGTQYPDVNQAYLSDFPRRGLFTAVRSAVNDDEWLDGDAKDGFIKTVAGRGGAVLRARGKSSAASAANACIDHMSTWWFGTGPGQMTSMAVPSDGSYGIPTGIVYSFPVTISHGEVSIVKDLPINPKSRVRMDKTAAELVSEKEAVSQPRPKM